MITDRPFQSPQAPLSHEPAPPPEPLLRLRVSTVLLLAALAWLLMSGRRYTINSEAVHGSLLAHLAQSAGNIATWYVLPALPFVALVAAIITAVVLIAQGRWRAVPQPVVETALALAASLFPMNYLVWALLSVIGAR